MGIEIASDLSVSIIKIVMFAKPTTTGVLLALAVLRRGDTTVRTGSSSGNIGFCFSQEDGSLITTR